MENNKVLVSVYCLAYNHEKYIRDCLDGFVKQKTNFKFEVIVHDDASTDGTADIIREYATQYPDIIKPIFQKENQYSKGIDIETKYILPILKGKYIAVCEGDDYWCDECKLQKQVSFLETNGDFIAIVHPTKVYNYLTKEESLLKAYDRDCVVGVRDVISVFIPLFHTTSVVYRKSAAPKIFEMKEMSWDYSKLVYLAVTGNIYYINDVMSVYRTQLPNSWTAVNSVKKDRKKNLRFQKDMIVALDFCNKYSQYKYDRFIDKSILNFEYQIWRAEPYFKLLFNPRLYKIGRLRTIKMIFRCLFSFK